jgi:hypothetical protein
MDHAEATSLRATERYLLGELDERERDAFEEHFFECAECAESVRSATTFLAGARPLLEGSKPAAVSKLTLPPTARTAAAPRRRGYFAAVSGLAAVLCLAAYQGLVVIPRLRGEVQDLGSLRAVPSRFLTVSRGEAPTVSVAAADRELALTLSQSFETPFPAYRCELRDASERALVVGTLTPRSATDELEVLLPLVGLPSGAYTLVVEGVETGGSAQRPGRAPVARYAFKIEHR